MPLFANVFLSAGMMMTARLVSILEDNVMEINVVLMPFNNSLKMGNQFANAKKIKT